MEPIPDGVPVEDAEAFHRWAFDRMDSWDALEVAAACGSIWQDHTMQVPLRLAAAFWLVGPGAGPAPGEVLDLLDGGADVPAAIAVGVRSEVAASLLGVGDVELARSLSKEVLDSVAADAGGPATIGIRYAAAALRNAVEVLDGVGDLESAGRAAEVMADLADAAAGQPDAGPVAALAALSALVHAERLDAAGLPDVDVESALGALEEASAAALVGRGVPMAVHGAIEVAQRRLLGGEPERAVAGLRAAAAAVPSGPGPAALRSRLHMLLADALDATEGPAAALDAQMVAVEASAELGVEPVEGWARRGLANQLAAAGRLPEALAEFERAVDLLSKGGDPIDVWALRLAWARTELVAGDPAAALRLADEVLDDIDGEAGEDRLDHARRAGPESSTAADLSELAVEALDIGAEAAWGTDPGEAEQRLLALADRLRSAGNPTALALSNAARAAARAGEVDRAEEHLATAFEELEALPDGAGDRLEPILLWRRSEVRWAADRNTEAAADADRGFDLATAIGDDSLAAQILAMGARARHDAWSNAVEAGEPAGSAGREAEDNLVHAIQLARSVDDDATAEELGARLDRLRSEG